MGQRTESTTALDLEAPILPGVGAAGIALGTPVARLPDALLVHFTAEPIINTCIQAPTGSVRYRSPQVDFWATDGVVDQVMVHDGYRGTWAGKLRLGMTLAEAEAACGRIVEDGEDNLTFAAIPGLLVEVPTPARATANDRDPAVWQASISGIYTFRAHGP